MVEGKYSARGKTMGKEMECHLDYHVEANILTGKREVMGGTMSVMD